LLALTGVGQAYDRALWVVPTNQGSPRRISNVTAHSAAWSPDGKTIAYSAGTRIYQLSESEASPKEIGSFAGLPIALEWSQDGRSLRFILQGILSERAEMWGQISLDEPKATVLRSLPASTIDSTYWTVTPERGTIFVQGGSRNLESRTVWLGYYQDRWLKPTFQAAPIGTVQGDIDGIAFSKESSHLFVVSEPQSRPAFISFDSQLHVFRRVLAGISGWYLDYSRDGKWIAFVGNEGRGLFVGRSDGSGIKKIASELEPAALPRWSPDGRQVAYMVQHPEHPWRIYILQRESGIVKEASEGSDGQGAPTWSPDGRFLVYGNVDCGFTSSCGIHQIDLASGKVKSVPDSEGLFTARWSPDGRFIAALHVEQHQLMLYEVKVGRWHRLANSIDGKDLSWSTDSKYLFANTGGPNAQIVRIRVSDGRRDIVFNFQSQDRFGMAETDDLQFSLAPDDSVVLHRRVHSEEIYAYDVRNR